MIPLLHLICGPTSEANPVPSVYCYLIEPGLGIATHGPEETKGKHEGWRNGLLTNSRGTKEDRAQIGRVCLASHSAQGSWIPFLSPDPERKNHVSLPISPAAGTVMRASSTLRGLPFPPLWMPRPPRTEHLYRRHSFKMPNT